MAHTKRNLTYDPNTNGYVLAFNDLSLFCWAILRLSIASNGRHSGYTGGSVLGKSLYSQYTFPAITASWNLKHVGTHGHTQNMQAPAFNVCSVYRKPTVSPCLDGCFWRRASIQAKILSLETSPVQGRLRCTAVNFWQRSGQKLNRGKDLKTKTMQGEASCREGKTWRESQAGANEVYILTWPYFGRSRSNSAQ